MLVNMIVKMNLTITTGEVDAQLPSIASDLEGEGMGAQQFADWLYGAFGFSTEEVDPSVQLDKAAADSKEAYPVTLPTPSRGRLTVGLCCLTLGLVCRRRRGDETGGGEGGVSLTSRC